MAGQRCREGGVPRGGSLSGGLWRPLGVAVVLGSVARTPEGAAVAAASARLPRWPRSSSQVCELPLGIAKRTRSQSVLARALATHHFKRRPLCDSLACIQSVPGKRHNRWACSTLLAALAPRIDPRQQPSCGDGVRCDEQRSPFSSTARRRRTRSPASAAATPTARRRPNPWRRAPAGRRASPQHEVEAAWAANSRS